MVSKYFSTHYRTIKRFNKIARIELSLVNSFAVVYARAPVFQ